MKPKILHLTLKKQWFDLTAAGLKPEEFRLGSDRWCKRLMGKPFDEIWYYNGGYHSPDKFPFCRVVYGGSILGLGKNHNPLHGEIMDPNKLYIAIKNGNLLETRNWKKLSLN